MLLLRRSYTIEINLDDRTPAVRRAIHALAWYGYAARGVIIALLGFFLLRGGLNEDASKVGDTDTAFDTIGGGLIGDSAFFVVAVGTVAYGLFMYACALFYRFERRGQSGARADQRTDAPLRRIGLQAVVEPALEMGRWRKVPTYRYNVGTMPARAPRTSTLGIRQLKAGLSRHLRRVEAGETIAVTDRGRVIATINPAPHGEDEHPTAQWARALVASGKASWSGGKPSGASAPARLRGKGTVADAVIEDRR